MTMYVDGVMFLNFLVDFLLLVGAAKFCGATVKIKRVLAASALGGLYAGCCLLPGFHFLGNGLWRAVSFAGISVIAYGFSVSAIRRGLVFAFLTLALGGAVLMLGKGGVIGILGTAVVMCILCGFGFRGQIGGTKYVPVELVYGDKRLQLTALRDTGNTLTDPVTGQSVLVVGADAANQLTGLTREQLRKPVESLTTLPGLRLIPYSTVGAAKGFLLALRLKNVKIGAWQGSALVAFAPEVIHGEGAYQALTGGTV